MTKLVNLDELAAAKRQLKYNGETHSVRDLPLAEFIEFQRDFQSVIDAQEKGDVAGMLTAAKMIIEKCVPTFKDAEQLNMRQLMATVQLVADFYPADNASGEPGKE